MSTLSPILRNHKDGLGGANRIPCPPQVAFSSSTCSTGLDFLKVSLWLDWSSSSFLTSLNDRKHAIQETDDSEGPFREIGGLQFNLCRSGAGKYSYVLKSGDITLLFSNHKSDAPFPNCRIEIGSVSCWDPGWEYLFFRLRSWLCVFGARIVKEQVSEFHITADLLGVSFQDTDLIDLDRWIRRARKWSFAGECNTINYMSFGKGDLMLRIYDKTSELKKNAAKAVVFHNVWTKKIGCVPDHVTRVEYQLRRPVFKEMNIHTVDDLRNCQNAVWAYCTDDWTRFCSGEVDRDNKHQSRSVPAFLWSVVQSLSFVNSSEYKLVRRKPLLTDIEQLKKQAAGCLLSVCAAAGQDFDDIEGHISTAVNFLEQQIRENFKEYSKYVRKMFIKLNCSYVGI